MNIQKNMEKVFKRIIAFEIASILLSAAMAYGITGCESAPDVVTYKYEVVAAKTKDLEDGDTRYNIAFKSGYSSSFSYGLYNYYEIGDTVWFEHNSGDFVDWRVIDKKPSK